jgi:ribonuclease HI
LLKRLKIGPLEWDYLIVSDGSGTIMNKPCGWCGVLIRRGATFERKYFHGAMNTGTNVVAEIMGFAQSLLWLSRQKHRVKPAKIHILTDCEVVKNIGNRKSSRKSNKALWFFIGALERELGTVTFHWMPRETTTLNRFSDRVAGMSRKLLLGEMEEPAIELLKLKNAKSIHDLNPS